MSKDNEKSIPWLIITNVGTLLVAIIAAVASISSANISAESRTKINKFEGELTLDIESMKGELTREIELMKGDLKQQEINLAIGKFEETKSARKDQILATWIPLLVSEDESERNAALAVLFALYPGHAEEILNNVKSSIAVGDQPTILDDAIKSADTLSKVQGNWIVVAGTFKSIAEANKWIEDNKTEDFSWSVYKFKEGFAPSAGPYPTKDAAEIALIGIRNSFISTAYLINLDTTCKDLNESSDKKFISCN